MGHEQKSSHLYTSACGLELNSLVLRIFSFLWLLCGQQSSHWLAVSTPTPLAPESERSLPYWDGEPVYVVKRAGMRIPGCADTSLLNSRLCRYEPFKASLTLHCAEHAPTCTYPLDKNTKISTWQEYKNIHLTRIQNCEYDKNTKTRPPKFGTHIPG